MLSKVYSRYIDVVYAVLTDANSCSRFLSILKFRRNDMKITVEKANKSLNFLEIKLNNVGLILLYGENLKIENCC